MRKLNLLKAGLTAAEGFDCKFITYERSWHLDQEGDQADLAWLLVYVLKPKVIHLGTPCTKMCRIGARQIDNRMEKQNEFSAKCLLHQEATNLFGSVENPKGTRLYTCKPREK